MHFVRRVWEIQGNNTIYNLRLGQPDTTNNFGWSTSRGRSPVAFATNNFHSGGETLQTKLLEYPILCFISRNNATY
jgi:hypothetical protein